MKLKKIMGLGFLFLCAAYTSILPMRSAGLLELQAEYTKKLYATCNTLLKESKNLQKTNAHENKEKIENILREGNKTVKRIERINLIFREIMPLTESFFAFDFLMDTQLWKELNLIHPQQENIPSLHQMLSKYVKTDIGKIRLAHKIVKQKNYQHTKQLVKQLHAIKFNPAKYKNTQNILKQIAKSQKIILELSNLYTQIILHPKQPSLLQKAGKTIPSALRSGAPMLLYLLWTSMLCSNPAGLGVTALQKIPVGYALSSLLGNNPGLLQILLMYVLPTKLLPPNIIPNFALPYGQWMLKNIPGMGYVKTLASWANLINFVGMFAGTYVPGTKWITRPLKWIRYPQIINYKGLNHAFVQPMQSFYAHVNNTNVTNNAHVQTLKKQKETLEDRLKEHTITQIDRYLGAIKDMCKQLNELHELYKNDAILAPLVQNIAQLCNNDNIKKLANALEEYQHEFPEDIDKIITFLKISDMLFHPQKANAKQMIFKAFLDAAELDVLSALVQATTPSQNTPAPFSIIQLTDNNEIELELEKYNFMLESAEIMQDKSGINLFKNEINRLTTLAVSALNLGIVQGKNPQVNINKTQKMLENFYVK